MYYSWIPDYCRRASKKIKFKKKSLQIGYFKTELFGKLDIAKCKQNHFDVQQVE